LKKAPPRPALPADEVARINQQFREEASTYSLEYRCQVCIHVHPGTGGCSLGYPNEVLAKGEIRALDEGAQFVFCKDWELDS